MIQTNTTTKTWQAAKPARAEQVQEGEHVRIAEDKAKIKAIQQSPEQAKVCTTRRLRRVLLGSKNFEFKFALLNGVHHYF